MPVAAIAPPGPNIRGLAPARCTERTSVVSLFEFVTWARRGRRPGTAAAFPIARGSPPSSRALLATPPVAACTVAAAAAVSSQQPGRVEAAHAVQGALARGAALQPSRGGREVVARAAAGRGSVSTGPLAQQDVLLERPPPRPKQAAPPPPPPPSAPSPEGGGAPDSDAADGLRGAAAQPTSRRRVWPARQQPRPVVALPAALRLAELLPAAPGAGAAAAGGVRVAAREERPPPGPGPGAPHPRHQPPLPWPPERGAEQGERPDVAAGQGPGLVVELGPGPGLERLPSTAAGGGGALERRGWDPGWGVGRAGGPPAGAQGGYRGAHTGGGVGGGADLYGRINRCGSWQELRDLQHSHSALLLPQHMPALMSAAAKLLARSDGAAAEGDGGGGSSSRRGAPPRAARAPGGDPAARSEPADAAAHLAYVWALAGSVLRLARSRELPPRSLATALWAAAKLPLEGLERRLRRQGGPHEWRRPGGGAAGGARAGPAEWEGAGAAAASWQPLASGALPRRADWVAWAVEVLRGCVPLLPGFGPQDLSMALWAAATLDCTPLPPGFLAMATAAARPRLGAFSPQATSNMLWALARLRHQPPRPWLDAVCAASAPQLRLFEPQALANTASALAKMDYAPPPHWCAALLDAAASTWAPHPPPPPPPQAADGAAAAPYMPRPPPPPPPQSLALTLWAMARLGLRPGEAWLGAMAAAAAAAAPRMCGQDVANVLWALGALRYRPGPAPQHPAPSPAGQAGAGAGAGAGPPRSDASAGGSGSDAEAAAAAPALVLSPLLLAWRRCADDMQPQELSACLVAAAHLQLGAAGAAGGRAGPGEGPSGAAAEAVAARPVAAVGPAAEQAWLWALAALGRRLGAASGQCVANALWAAARLGCRPSNAWMVAAVGHFAECLEADDAGPQEAANVWWALGALRWAPAPEVGQGLLVRTLLLAAAGDLRSGEVAMVLGGVARLGLRLPRPLLDRLVKLVHSTWAQEQQQQQQQQQQQPGPGPGGARADPSANTLVTLLRAIDHMGATSQRSAAAVTLLRALRAAEADVAAATAAATQAELGGADGGAAAGAAGRDAAFRVALALRSSAALGCTLAAAAVEVEAPHHRLRRGHPRPAAARGALQQQHEGRVLAAAAVAALRAVLPYCNGLDLGMSLRALAVMRAALPLPLLLAALLRAAALCGGGDLAARGREGLPQVLYGLGGLVRLWAARNRAMADEAEAARLGAEAEQGGAGTADGSAGAGSGSSPAGGGARGGAGSSERGLPPAAGAWEEQLASPRLAAARSVLLCAVHQLLLLEEPPPPRAPPAHSGAGAGAGALPLLSSDVQQLVCDIATLRLRPDPPLLRLLGAAIAARSHDGGAAGGGAELSDATPERPAQLLAASLRQLDAMGGELDPRTAAQLAARLRGLRPAAALRPAPLMSTCGAVRALVRRWELRQPAPPQVAGAAAGAGPGSGAARGPEGGASGGPGSAARARVELELRGMCEEARVCWLARRQAGGQQAAQGPEAAEAAA